MSAGLNYFFFISTKKMDLHHPSREVFPNWILAIPATLHKVVSAVQQMATTEENLAILRAFIDSLEFEYLMKRRGLDEQDAIPG
jgi:hypothetical protein